MKKILLATVLLICIAVMAYTDYQIIQGAPYPSLSQEQTQ